MTAAKHHHVSAASHRNRPETSKNMAPWSTVTVTLNDTKPTHRTRGILAEPESGLFTQPRL
ncbi:hypothetical protein E4K10_14645 [Streptomyces sp. T1317-0309]|nr:hypothetical protein E4K10_14645 [Streptomyces sp. T1317-0309]